MFHFTFDKKGVMKLLILIIIQLFGLVHVQTNENKIIGQWKAESEKGKQSEFYLAKDGFYYGKLIPSDEKPDYNGKIIMKKLVYDASTNTYKGTMNPPDKDLELAVTISFVTNDKIKVVAKKFFMSKTMYFIRIK